MILKKIVARKHEEVAALQTGPLELPARFRDLMIEPPRGFAKSLTDYPGVAIIAEVKKASPSKGVISHDFDPVAIAGNYERRGAQAISVLTDVDFFQGSLDYLTLVRQAVALPVLRKDFIIDEIQVHEARLYGADAILLIAAILDEQQLRGYRQLATELGMDSLVEVHDEPELELALRAGSTLIGINNRNLHDFTVDVETTLRLARLLPENIPVVSESGLKDSADIEILDKAGICAALIGESLMRAGSSGTLLEELRQHRSSSENRNR